MKRQEIIVCCPTCDAHFVTHEAAAVSSSNTWEWVLCDHDHDFVVSCNVETGELQWINACGTPEHRKRIFDYVGFREFEEPDGPDSRLRVARLRSLVPALWRKGK